MRQVGYVNNHARSLQTCFKNHYDMINTSLASILDVGFFAGPEQHLTRIWKKIRGWSLELLRMPFTNLLVNLNDCSKPCST